MMRKSALRALIFRPFLPSKSLLAFGSHINLYFYLQAYGIKVEGKGRVKADSLNHVLA